MNEYKFSFYTPEEKLPDDFERVYFTTGDDIYTGYFRDNFMGTYFVNDFGQCIIPRLVKEWSYM